MSAGLPSARPLHRIVFVVWMTLAATQALLATPVAAGEGVLAAHSGKPVAAEHASRWCVDGALSNWRPEWSSAAQRSCDITWVALGRGLYRGRYSQPSEDDPDVRNVAEVLLHELPESPGMVVPIFWMRSDEIYEFLDPLSLHDLAGETVIHARSCLNGTGGCRQQFLRYADGQLHQIGLSISQTVRDQLPADVSHVRVYIVPDKLEGTAQGWTDRDGNCCGTYQATVLFEMLDGDLRVRHVKWWRDPTATLE